MKPIPKGLQVGPGRFAGQRLEGRGRNMEESLDDCLKKVLRKVLADSGRGGLPSAIHVSPNLHPKLADFQYGDFVKTADSVVFYVDSTLPVDECRGAWEDKEMEFLL